MTGMASSSSYPSATSSVTLKSSRSNAPDARYGCAAAGTTYRLSPTSNVWTGPGAPAAGSTVTAGRPSPVVVTRTTSPVTSVSVGGPLGGGTSDGDADAGVAASRSGVVGPARAGAAPAASNALTAVAARPARTGGRMMGPLW